MEMYDETLVIARKKGAARRFHPLSFPTMHISCFDTSLGVLRAHLDVSSRFVDTREWLSHYFAKYLRGVADHF